MDGTVDGGMVGGGPFEGAAANGALADDIEATRERLALLRQEHRDLDDVINRAAEVAPMDFLRLQRLKKRKLALKDQMARLESRLLPDIIA